MKRLIIAPAFFFLIFMHPLFGGDGVLIGPKLVCDEPEYNFGEVENTEEVEHLFILRNEGDETLEISRVRAGCGCIMARVGDERIRPGMETELRVRFSLRGRQGPQRQQIVVESNDPFRPRLKLAMVGEALSILMVKPERIFWGNVHEHDAREQSVELFFRLERPVDIVKSEISSSMFEIERSVIEHGKSHKILIRTVPPLKIGAFDLPLRIATDHCKFGEIIVPMNGRVVGDIFSVPGEIKFSPDDEEAATRFLMLRSSRNRRFNVVSVEPSVSGISAEIRSTGTASSLIYLKNMSARSDLDGASIRIVTDDEAVPELVVPIRIGAFENNPNP